MSDGSTVADNWTCLPVSPPRRASSALQMLRRQRRCRRDRCANDVAMFEQSIAIDLEEHGQQLEAAAIGQHREQLGHWWLGARIRRDRGHERHARAARHRGTRQRAAQLGVVCHRPHDRRQVLFDARGIRFPDGDIEQRLGITSCGGSQRHEYSAARASAVGPSAGRGRCGRLFINFTSVLFIPYAPASAPGWRWRKMPAFCVRAARRGAAMLVLGDGCISGDSPNLDASVAAR